MALAIKNNTGDDTCALSDNLNTLLQKNNLDTKTLHLHTGISIPAINILRRGEGNPTLSTLLTLAKYFNVSINDLISSQTTPTSAQQTAVPLYALNTFSLHKDNPAEMIYTNADTEITNNTFAIRLHNNLLSPTYEKGSVFIITPNIAYSDGDIALIAFKDKQYGFRKLFLQNDALLTQPINQPNTLTPLKQGKVIGIVVKVIQNLH